MRFPRAIRLDTSDPHVYEVAAEPGEWAVPAAFAFANTDQETLTGKARQAFSHGFLGTASFGWTTLVEVAEIDQAGYEEVVRRLADHFVACYGAPDREAALPAAREEAAFAAGLCDQKVHALLAVEREFGENGVVERFKVIRPPKDGRLARSWTVVEDDAPG